MKNEQAIIKFRKLNLSDVPVMDSRLNFEDSKNGKRQLRESLLTAYDSHKTTVLYENKSETSAEKSKILSWKQSLLDLDSNAFKQENIPNAIKYFYKG